MQRQQLDMSRVLAGLRYPQRLVYDILLRGNMLEESVVYQDILQEGKKMAFHEALQYESQFVLRLLSARLGRIAGRLKQRVESLSRQQMEQVGLASLNFNSKADLAAWLIARGR